MPELPDSPERDPQGVRETLAANIKRIRKRRDMSGREFIGHLQELGVKLLPSGLTALEKGERRLTVEELLAVAIVLNTSAIDLLTPEDGSPLLVAEGTEPLEPVWLELWLQGMTPWPHLPWKAGRGGSYDNLLDFLASASEHRRTMHRRDQRPEMQAIEALKERVRRAIELQEDDPTAVGDSSPDAMAGMMQQDLEEVETYVRLLANRIKSRGDGG